MCAEPPSRAALHAPCPVRRHRGRCLPTHRPPTRPLPPGAPAGGRVLFEGVLEPSQWITVAASTSVPRLTRFMDHYWGMPKPEVLITVTGGAQDFNLPSQLQVAFDRGLVSAARSAKAWIFTAGSDTGVCVPPRPLLPCPHPPVPTPSSPILPRPRPPAPTPPTPPPSPPSTARRSRTSRCGTLARPHAPRSLSMS